MAIIANISSPNTKWSSRFFSQSDFLPNMIFEFRVSKSVITRYPPLHLRRLWRYATELGEFSRKVMQFTDSNIIS
jgi:hypothetical protein